MSESPTDASGRIPKLVIPRIVVRIPERLTEGLVEEKVAGRGPVAPTAATQPSASTQMRKPEENPISQLTPQDHSSKMARAIQGGVNWPTEQLSNMIISICQSNYRELENLLEILPRMADIDRKRELLRTMVSQNRMLQKSSKVAGWTEWLPESYSAYTCLEKLAAFQNGLVKGADDLAAIATSLPATKMPQVVSLNNLYMTMGVMPEIPFCLRRLLPDPDPSIGLRDMKNLLMREIVSLRIPEGQAMIEIRTCKYWFFSRPFPSLPRQLDGLSRTCTQLVYPLFPFGIPSNKQVDDAMRSILLQALQSRLPPLETTKPSLLERIISIVDALLLAIFSNNVAKTMAEIDSRFNLGWSISNEHVHLKRAKIHVDCQWMTKPQQPYLVQLAINDTSELVVSLLAGNSKVLELIIEQLAVPSEVATIFASALLADLRGKMLLRALEAIKMAAPEQFLFFNPSMIGVSGTGKSYVGTMAGIRTPTEESSLPRLLEAISNIQNRAAKCWLVRILSKTLPLEPCHQSPFPTLAKHWVWFKCKDFVGGFLALRSKPQDSLQMVVCGGSVRRENRWEINKHDFGAFDLSQEASSKLCNFDSSFFDTSLQEFIEQIKRGLFERHALAHGLMLLQQNDKFLVLNAPVIYPVFGIHLHFQSATLYATLELAEQLPALEGLEEIKWEAPFLTVPLQMQGTPRQRLSRQLRKICTTIALAYQLSEERRPFHCRGFDEIALQSSTRLTLDGPDVVSIQSGISRSSANLSVYLGRSMTP